MRQVDLCSSVMQSTWHDGPHREKHGKKSSRWRPPCHVVLLLMLLAASSTLAVEPTLRDVEYARVGKRALKLDLYQPTKATSSPAPTIIWVHGGAWRAGSKDQVPVLQWREHGFAIASVDYRLS